MEEIAEGYGIELDVTQTQNNSNAETQGTSESDTFVSSQDSVITISAEDMEAFMNAITRKETELSEKLKHHTFRSQTEEDQMTVLLSELLAKHKALENGESYIPMCLFIHVMNIFNLHISIRTLIPTPTRVRQECKEAKRYSP